ncbi:MAG: R3H domain-containing nucleic acid-binding protein [Candidatus Liptonbacteria bacterium]|nr:R3H domain-containing nucleic acid-binding protein [Candidatus Liptonbacteria bacterium]
MEQWETFTKKLIEAMGFSDYKLEIDEEHRHASVYLYDGENVVKDNLPAMVESLNHLFQLIAQRRNTESLYLDINNYRKEREKLITELARAAARKVVATKKEMILPAMNSYERRIVHVELVAHPDVKTESEGVGKERSVRIKPL